MNHRRGSASIGVRLSSLTVRASYESRTRASWPEDGNPCQRLSPDRPPKHLVIPFTDENPRGCLSELCRPGGGPPSSRGGVFSLAARHQNGKQQRSSRLPQAVLRAQHIDSDNRRRERTRVNQRPGAQDDPNYCLEKASLRLRRDSRPSQHRGIVVDLPNCRGRRTKPRSLRGCSDGPEETVKKRGARSR